MKTWMRRSLFAVFGAGLLVAGLSACSHGRFGHGPMTEERIGEMREKMIERVSSTLKLDDAQRQKLAALADTLRAQRAALMGQAQDPRAELRALIAGEHFDRSAAQTLAEQKTRALQSASPVVISALADFYDSLKPEQQAQVRELMQQRKPWYARG
jgi:protein CpxP